MVKSICEKCKKGIAYDGYICIRCFVDRKRKIYNHANGILEEVGFFEKHERGDKTTKEFLKEFHKNSDERIKKIREFRARESKEDREERLDILERNICFKYNIEDGGM